MAFPGTYNFNYYRGDTAQFVVRPKNASDGSAYDLTDYSAIFTVANVRGSTGTQYSDAQGMTAVVNEATNIVTCTITSAGGRYLEPGSYVYDVQVNNNSQTQTLLTGIITVTDDITGAV
jgi:sarcosine oxidase delta subunit